MSHKIQHKTNLTYIEKQHTMKTHTYNLDLKIYFITSATAVHTSAVAVVARSVWSVDAEFTPRETGGSDGRNVPGSVEAPVEAESADQSNGHTVNTTTARRTSITSSEVTWPVTSASKAVGAVNFRLAVQKCNTQFEIDQSHSAKPPSLPNVIGQFIMHFVDNQSEIYGTMLVEMQVVIPIIKS